MIAVSALLVDANRQSSEAVASNSSGAAMAARIPWLKELVAERCERNSPMLRLIVLCSLSALVLIPDWAAAFGRRRRPVMTTPAVSPPQFVRFSPPYASVPVVAPIMTSAAAPVHVETPFVAGCPSPAAAPTAAPARPMPATKPAEPKKAGPKMAEPKTTSPVTPEIKKPIAAPMFDTRPELIPVAEPTKPGPAAEVPLVPLVKPDAPPLPTPPGAAPASTPPPLLPAKPVPAPAPIDPLPGLPKIDGVQGSAEPIKPLIAPASADTPAIAPVPTPSVTVPAPIDLAPIPAPSVTLPAIPVEAPAPEKLPLPAIEAPRKDFSDLKLPQFDGPGGVPIPTPAVPEPTPAKSVSKSSPLNHAAFEIYPIAGSTTVGVDRTVRFYNITDRGVKLRVNGESGELPARSVITAKLKGRLEWQIDSGDIEKVSIPETSPGLEIVIRK